MRPHSMIFILYNKNIKLCDIFNITYNFPVAVYNIINKSIIVKFSSSTIYFIRIKFNEFSVNTSFIYIYINNVIFRAYSHINDIRERKELHRFFFFKHENYIYFRHRTRANQTRFTMMYTLVTTRTNAKTRY